MKSVIEILGTWQECRKGKRGSANENLHLRRLWVQTSSVLRATCCFWAKDDPENSLQAAIK